MESAGPTIPLPDRKLLLFVLDRLQKCVQFDFLFILIISFSWFLIAFCLLVRA